MEAKARTTELLHEHGLDPQCGGPVLAHHWPRARVAAKPDPQEDLGVPLGAMRKKGGAKSKESPCPSGSKSQAKAL